MNDAFTGSRVVVTGAAGGIGRELCNTFAAAGARVVAIDRDRPGLAEVEAVTTEAIVLDITDRAAVERAITGPVDVLVNNAGLTALGPFAGVSADAFQKVLDVNVIGSANVTRAALPGLIAQGGRIGVLSSVAGFAPLVHRTAYAASKHALHGMFESLRAELVPEGVSVTMVCPTFVDTGIESRAVERAAGEDGEWTTTGRHLSPAAVARAVVDALATRRRLVLPGTTAKLAYAMWRMSPAGYDRMMRRRIG